jgi:hypothetical protein
MIRVLILYEGDVDPARYQQHLDEFVAPIGATFRHGKVFGSAPGMEQRYHHYAEFELPDMEAFQSVASSDEFAAAGQDAAEMGVPFTVHFAEVD